MILHIFASVIAIAILATSLLMIAYCLWTFRLSIISALLRETPRQREERRIRHLIRQAERRIGR